MSTDVFNGRPDDRKKNLELLNKEQSDQADSYIHRFEQANRGRKKRALEMFDLRTLFFMESILRSDLEKFEGLSFGKISAPLGLGLFATLRQEISKSMSRIFGNKEDGTPGLIHSFKGALDGFVETVPSMTNRLRESVQRYMFN